MKTDLQKCLWQQQKFCRGAAANSHDDSDEAATKKNDETFN
jgi:hypothetical protein